MKNKFTLNESERERILNLHEQQKPGIINRVKGAIQGFKNPTQQPASTTTTTPVAATTQPTATLLWGETAADLGRVYKLLQLTVAAAEITGNCSILQLLRGRISAAAATSNSDMRPAIGVTRRQLTAAGSKRLKQHAANICSC